MQGILLPYMFSCPRCSSRGSCQNPKTDMQWDWYWLDFSTRFTFLITWSVFSKSIFMASALSSCFLWLPKCMILNVLLRLVSWSHRFNDKYILQKFKCNVNGHILILDPRSFYIHFSIHPPTPAITSSFLLLSVSVSPLVLVA